MSYVLEALLLSPEARDRFQRALPKIVIVQLAPEVAMVPLTEDELKQLGSLDPVCQIGDEGEFSGLTKGVIEELSRLTQYSLAAFVGALYTGGPGTQWGVIFLNGRPTAPPAISGSFINRALAKLGIRAANGMDEFDTVGLGRHRHTEDWIINDSCI